MVFPAIDAIRGLPLSSTGVSFSMTPLSTVETPSSTPASSTDVSHTVTIKAYLCFRDKRTDLVPGFKKEDVLR